MDQQRSEDKAQARVEADIAVGHPPSAKCVKRYWQSLWCELDMTSTSDGSEESRAGQTVHLTFTPDDLVRLASMQLCSEHIHHGADPRRLAAHLAIKLQEIYAWAHPSEYGAVVDLDVYPITVDGLSHEGLPHCTSDSDGNTTLASMRSIQPAGKKAECYFVMPGAMADYPLYAGSDFALFRMSSTAQLRRVIGYRVLWSFIDKSLGAGVPIEDVVVPDPDSHPGQLSDRNLAKLLGLPPLKPDQKLASLTFGPDTLRHETVGADCELVNQQTPMVLGPITVRHMTVGVQLGKEDA